MRFHRPFCSLRMLSVLGVLFGAAHHADLPAQESPPTELSRIEPLSVEQALESFEIAPGYRIELVAAEPLVFDPVAFCFDARGRMIVAEMIGYSERDQDHAGRVVRLRDDNNDGVMDHREVLIEGLSWPTAVAAVNDGVLVAAAPDLIWIPNDRNQTSASQAWLQGFGKTNVQGLVNSLRWGLDIRLHGATSSSSGTLVGLGQAKGLNLGRRDFAIDPWAQRVEPVDGGGQHGMCIDPWGDKFVCSNSDHLQQVWMLPSRPDRTLDTLQLPKLRRSIATDGPQADVFRISPVEPWRILRTHMRVTGQARGPIEGGGRAAGYFTGATGVYVYDGDQWGETDEPIALVCDVGSNLVHRKRMPENGIWRSGIRMDAKTEFLRSQDIWFRPVQLGTGPDGALYIADMYREVIEHPKSLPPPIKSQLDLNSGNDRGRIWRIVSTENEVRRGSGNLADLSTNDLIAQLDHPNQWNRRTAARLLMDAQRLPQESRESWEDALGDVVTRGEHAEGRLQGLALWVRMQSKSEAVSIPVKIWNAAIRDSHPRVRQRAVEWVAASPSIVSELDAALLLELASDSSPYVRFQVAYDAIALFPDPMRRVEALLQITRRSPNDAMIVWAAEGSMQGVASQLFGELVARSSIPSGWLNAVAFQMMRQSGDPSHQVIASVERAEDTDQREQILGALALSVEKLATDRQFTQFAEWILTHLAPELETESEEGAAAGQRAEVDIPARFRLVRWADRTVDGQVVSGLIRAWLRTERDSKSQLAVLNYLVDDSAEHMRAVAIQVSELTPAMQLAATNRLAASRVGLGELAKRLRSGEVIPESVTPQTMQRLAQYADYEPPNVDGARVVSGYSESLFDTYSESLSTKPDLDAGAKVFQRVCSSCHRVGNIGQQVGPDLKSIVGKSDEQILLSIMDPNREIDPKYLVVQVETEDGRLISGIVQQETEGGMVLVDSQGKPHRVNRDEISAMKTRNLSLMPEGLTREITPKQMRDLISFLRT